jgi:hypothetical protein
VARASAAALLVLLAELAFASPAHGALRCARWAADAGSDRNPGTRAAPFRHVGFLASRLQPGQTGCLVAGAIFNEHVVINRGGRAGRPIRIITAGPRRATITGIVRIRAANVILAKVSVLGDGAAFGAIVTATGDRVQLLRLSVSGPGYLNRRVACIAVKDGARGVVIQHNEVHDCSRSSTRGSFASGIVVANARGTRVLDNYVWHIPGDGIVLAPNADGTLVSHNVVDGNVNAIFLGGNRRYASSGNTIAQNVLSNSGKWNVHSLFLGAAGRGNAVTGNCVWHGFRSNFSGRGFAQYGNRFTSPRFTNRPATLTMRPGPCFAKRPRPYQLDTTDYGLPFPKVARFLVHWTVRALSGRVQIVNLFLWRLRPGGSASLRCVRGCSLRETVYANRAGSGRSLQLTGQWLPRGALLEVRARAPGAVGHYARIHVLGLPRGIAVSHACLSPFGSFSPVPCERYP